MVRRGGRNEVVVRRWMGLDSLFLLLDEIWAGWAADNAEGDVCAVDAIAGFGQLFKGGPIDRRFAL